MSGSGTAASAGAGGAPLPGADADVTADYVEVMDASSDTLKPMLLSELLTGTGCVTEGGNGAADAGKLVKLRNNGGAGFGSTQVPGSGAGMLFAVCSSGIAIQGSATGKGGISFEAGMQNDRCTGYSVHLSSHADQIGLQVDGSASTNNSGVAVYAYLNGATLVAAGGDLEERISIWGSGTGEVRFTPGGGRNSNKRVSLTATAVTGKRTVELPDNSGTLALLQAAQTWTGANTFSGNLLLEKTVTPAGIVGPRTISKNAGSVNFGPGASALKVTNSRVTPDSVILLTVASNDATMKSASCVAANGSFTIRPNALPTGETRVNFLVIN